MGLPKINNLDPGTIAARPEVTLDSLANTLLVQRWRDDGSLAIRVEWKPYSSSTGHIDRTGASGKAGERMVIENAWVEMQRVPALAELAAAQVVVLDMYAEKATLERQIEQAQPGEKSALEDALVALTAKMESTTLAELLE